MNGVKKRKNLYRFLHVRRAQQFHACYQGAHATVHWTASTTSEDPNPVSCEIHNVLPVSATTSRSNHFRRPARLSDPCGLNRTFKEQRQKVMLSLCLSRHEDVWGNGGIALPFLALALDGGEWTASGTGRFTPWGRFSSVHWIRGWMSSRAHLDACAEEINLALAGNWKSAVQSVGRRYTDWAIPTPAGFFTD